jgi:hypothetical protein
MDTGTVPHAWNVAEMFVLYKGKGPVDSGDSYRAISLTDIMGKLFERVIFARALVWYESQPVSKLPQFGFRPQSSTHNATFTLRGIIHAHKVLKQAYFTIFLLFSFFTYVSQ